MNLLFLDSNYNTTMKIKNLTFGLLTLGIAHSGAAIVWNAGKADNAQQYNFGAPGPGGGGENVKNIREFGGNTALPGSPTNVGSADGDAVRDVDDDYYFAGNYVTTVGNAYTGVGIVAANEEAMERAWTAGDTDLRYHFNMPAATGASDELRIRFGLTNGFHNPDAGATTWNITVSMNGISQLDQEVSVATLNGDWETPAFTIADVGGAAILAGDYDNYVTLNATRTAGTGGWVSLDYAEFDITPVPEPSSSLYLLGLAGLGFTYRRRNK